MAASSPAGHRDRPAGAKFPQRVKVPPRKAKHVHSWPRWSHGRLLGTNMLPKGEGGRQQQKRVLLTRLFSVVYGYCGGYPPNVPKAFIAAGFLLTLPSFMSRSSSAWRKAS